MVMRINSVCKQLSQINKRKIRQFLWIRFKRKTQLIPPINEILPNFDIHLPVFTLFLYFEYTYEINASIQTDTDIFLINISIN